MLISEQHHRRDRLQLRARRHRDRPVRDLDDAARSRYSATYHLRSNDYYSSRNYASRLIGTKLVFYTPLVPQPVGRRAVRSSSRRCASGAPARRRRLQAHRAGHAHLPHRRGARPDTRASRCTPSRSCDLAKPEMRCESTAVLGAAGTRVLRVGRLGVRLDDASGGAVPHRRCDGSARLPHPARRRGAERAEDGRRADRPVLVPRRRRRPLNVLLRANGRGDGMWAAERSAGRRSRCCACRSRASPTARDSAPRSAYRALPPLPGYALQSRYVGDYLLYGARRRLAPARMRPRVALRRARRRRARTLPLAHGVDASRRWARTRWWSATRAGTCISPACASRAPRPRAHSHVRATRRRARRAATAFSTGQGARRRPGRPADHRRRSRGGAATAASRRRCCTCATATSGLAPIGKLSQRRPRQRATTDCRASCVDWYGNARPVFLGDRVFALLGYELVEGRLSWRGWPGKSSKNCGA